MAVKFLNDNQLRKLSAYYDDTNENFYDHGMSHVLGVRQIAEDICRHINVPYTIEIELGALLHDVGLIEGRKKHHIAGANMVEGIIKALNVECDIELVKTMVHEHRTSNKNINAFPIDVKIVNLADRGISFDMDENIRKIAKRSYIYTSLIHPECSVDEIIDLSTHYTMNKYGDGGYIYKNQFLNEVYGKELPKAMNEKYEKFIREYADSLKVEDRNMNIVEFDNWEKNNFGNY